MMIPKKFEQYFINWTNAVFKKTDEDIIPIDGKLLRGPYDKKSNVHAINVMWSEPFLRLMKLLLFPSC